MFASTPSRYDADNKDNFTAYKLLVAFKGRHLDFFGSNKNQRLALRTNLTRLTTLVEYLQRTLLAIPSAVG